MWSLDFLYAPLSNCFMNIDYVLKGLSYICLSFSGSGYISFLNWTPFPWWWKQKTPRYTPFPKGIPFLCNKTLPYHGWIKCCCQFFYTNNMDFLVGVSPDIGYFMVNLSCIYIRKLHFLLAFLLTVGSLLLIHILMFIVKYSFRLVHLNPRLQKKWCSKLKCILTSMELLKLNLHW